MNSTTAVSAPGLLSAEVASCLGGGATLDSIDRFLDRLFDLAVKLGSVRCSLGDSETIRIQTPDGKSCHTGIDRALAKFRATCARLSARCEEWSRRPVSLYGDTVDVQTDRERYTVRFENTAETQLIEVASAANSSSNASAARA